MATFEASFKVPSNGHAHLVLDQKPMRIVDGKASRQIAAGDHKIGWLVAAPVGRFSLLVTSPESAKPCSVKDVVIGDDGFSWGVCEFVST